MLKYLQFGFIDEIEKLAALTVPKMVSGELIKSTIPKVSRMFARPKARFRMWPTTPHGFQR